MNNSGPLQGATGNGPVSMGPGGLVSMAPMTSISGDLPGTVVSSGMSQMGPGGNMQPMPMRPMMGGGIGGPQTIIASQQGMMSNGPILANTISRTVVGPAGPMGNMQFRQQSQPNMMPGQQRMNIPGVRMVRVRV